MQTTTGTTPTSTAPIDPDTYQPMLDAVHTHFGRQGDGPLFVTDVDGAELWRAWLAAMPELERQHHNCHSCRRFIEAFGGLVGIDEDGTTVPAILAPDAPGIYGASFEAARKLVAKARVVGVHVSSSPVWGLAMNADTKRERVWRHLHVNPPAALRYKAVLLDAGQRAAELREDYATLSRALGEFREATVKLALQIAESDALYRSEKIKGRLTWIAELQEARGEKKGRARENVTWLAVATAPAGFCHIRSSVIGPLLEDLEAGKSFDEVKRSFDAKMHPLQYQRPQAAPSDGNIKQAEAIVEKLGVAPSLRRRFARLEDLKTVWTPPPPKGEPKKEGVFGHLRASAKSSVPMSTTGPKMTYAKFAATVLESAEAIEVFAPTHAYYTAFTTAAVADAPPILQWDLHPVENEGRERNPVAWYTYHGGSPASSWGLLPGTYVPVTAVSLMPNLWQEGFERQGKGVMFVLAGCKDKRAPNVCLFPETLKSELHSVRSTIEAFSRRELLEGYDEASACGLTVRAETKDAPPLRVRVLARGTLTEYSIDRWD